MKSQPILNGQTPSKSILRKFYTSQLLEHIIPQANIHTTIHLADIESIVRMAIMTDIVDLMESKPSKILLARRLSMMATDTFITQRRTNAAIAAQLSMVAVFWSLTGWLERHMREKFHIQMILDTRLIVLTNGIRKDFKIISTTRLRTRTRWRGLFCRLIRCQMIFRSSTLAQWSTHLISQFLKSLIFARRVRLAHGCQLARQWEGLRILRQWMMSDY